MKHMLKTALLAASLLGATDANATTTVVDFEGIFDWDLVDGYGGLSGWESMAGQVSSYSEFEVRDPALGENRLHSRAGELTFDQGPVIFEGLHYNYWGSDTDVSFSLFYQGQWVYAGLVDKIQFHGQSSDGFIVDNLTYSTTPVPLPGAIWLFGSGLVGLMLRSRQSRGG